MHKTNTQKLLLVWVALLLNCAASPHVTSQPTLVDTTELVDSPEPGEKVNQEWRYDKKVIDRAMFNFSKIAKQYMYSQQSYSKSKTEPWHGEGSEEEKVPRPQYVFPGGTSVEHEFRRDSKFKFAASLENMFEEVPIPPNYFVSYKTGEKSGKDATAIFSISNKDGVVIAEQGLTILETEEVSISPLSFTQISQK